MRGFTLLEFVVATTLFLFLLLAGYENVKAQKDWIELEQTRTRSEVESNYRLLILKHLLEDSSESFRAESLFEIVPTFFTDLNFGQTQRQDAFSVTLSNGTPGRFQREGNLYRLIPVTALKTGEMLMLAGVCQSGDFGWNYARITAINGEYVDLSFLLQKETPEKGAWVKVQVNGFVWKQRTLYWISPSGQASPFLDPLDDFSYSWTPPQLTIYWRSGRIETRFTSTL